MSFKEEYSGTVVCRSDISVTYDFHRLRQVRKKRNAPETSHDCDQRSNCSGRLRNLKLAGMCDSKRKTEHHRKQAGYASYS